MSDQDNTVQVVFTPSGKRGAITVGKSVLEAAQQLGVDLDTVCGGRGICDRCQIDHSVGEFAKFKIHSNPDHLSPLSASEQEFFPEGTVVTRRLGCQAKLFGDVVIDVPPESQAHRQVVRKRLDVHNITLNPAVRLHYVEVPQPNMHDPSGDSQRLLDALEFDWGLTGIDIDFHLLGSLQSILREGDWKATLAIHNEKQAIAIWPGIKNKIYGVAIDVGSTTIAAHLCDLISGQAINSAGRMNPQIRFGEDLMSRVSYVMMNPGGETDMTRAIQEALHGLIKELVEEMDIDINDVLDMTLVGNPVMHHLLLGISPVELGGAPFALATDQALNIKASDLNLGHDFGMNPGARAYILPCIAGHVGADAAAATLSEAPYERDELTLLVDVGTNAEIVLGNNKKMVAASSPTGPAFEGAQISGGQRAAPGAIERVRIDNESLEPKFRVIGSALWSDESGFKQEIEKIGVTGICGSGIIEVIAEMFLAGLIKTDGVIDGSLAARSARVVADKKTWSYNLYDEGKVKVVITQNDVRAIQLAKAALYAGSRLLMDKLNIDAVDRIRLAGAFGAHIDVKYAMVLGMIPDCKLEHVTSAGNAAGAGATIALLDTAARHEIEGVVKRIQKVETAVEPKFQDYFVDALAIPHKTDNFVNLKKVVDLPAPSQVGNDDKNGGRARRRKRR
ncbi:ASKHA domain-containing protein [Candidatus Spongiihabitans sp.]|uniref:ASKHA domain-containing protein n=1 Tax=Candidatus Spongiihabitans sp. TaxID=3101308 RepID=UPI003C705BB3